MSLPLVHYNSFSVIQAQMYPNMQLVWYLVQTGGELKKGNPCKWGSEGAGVSSDASLIVTGLWSGTVDSIQPWTELL
jgi:hypothetical protein